MSIEPGKFYKSIWPDVKFKVVSIDEVLGEVFVLVFEQTEYGGSSFIKQEDFLSYVTGELK